MTIELWTPDLEEVLSYPQRAGNPHADSLFAEHSPLITVVIPTLNEALNLPYVLPKIPRWVHEVILVDGYSTDETVNVARQLRPDIRVVMQKGKGKGDALRTGFAAAAGDIIVMLDGDGSMDPSEMPVYIGALLSGADYAKGSRFMQGGSTHDMEWYRHVGNWGLGRLVWMLFGGRYTDLCYGYNAFWKAILPDIRLDADGFEIETLMNIRVLALKFKVVEIFSHEAPRINGVSHLHTIRDGWRVLKTILKEWVTFVGPASQTKGGYGVPGSKQLASLAFSPLPGRVQPCPTCGKPHEQ